ncbi:hypothetical protein DB347_17845 [Opitutaceae bacterium EW11]|nr:hypothetical protein DB347_17845 [Opitutaceae bacterium EW11]
MKNASTKLIFGAAGVLAAAAFIMTIRAEMRGEDPILWVVVTACSLLFGVVLLALKGSRQAAAVYREGDGERWVAAEYKRRHGSYVSMSRRNAPSGILQAQLEAELQNLRRLWSLGLAGTKSENLGSVFGGSPLPPLSLVQLRDGKWFLEATSGSDFDAFKDVYRPLVLSDQQPTRFPTRVAALTRAREVLAEVYPGKSLLRLDQMNHDKAEPM